MQRHSTHKLELIGLSLIMFYTSVNHSYLLHLFNVNLTLILYIHTCILNTFAILSNIMQKSNSLYFSFEIMRLDIYVASWTSTCYYYFLKKRLFYFSVKVYMLSINCTTNNNFFNIFLSACGLN